MQQQKQPIQLLKQNQNNQHQLNLHSHLHPHCQHKYLNRKFTNVLIQLGFDQQLPIKLDGCVVTVEGLVKQQQRQQLKHVSQHPIIKPNPQSFILINYHPMSLSQQHINNNTNTNNKRLQLLIPLTQIMCVAKKTSKTSLIMVKDVQKVIQYDENGYQLVSDQDQQQFEQFEQHKNELYEGIKKAIVQISQQKSTVQQLQQQQQEQQLQQSLQKQHHHHHTNPIVITINKQCKILLTPIKQQSLCPQLTKHITTNNHQNNNNNNILGQKPQQQQLSLYQFLSHKLQQHERQQQQLKKQQHDNDIKLQIVGKSLWQGNIQKISQLNQQMYLSKQQNSNGQYEQQHQLEDNNQYQEDDDEDYQQMDDQQRQQDQDMMVEQDDNTVHQSNKNNSINEKQQQQ